ncbi:MAG: hypothetical protein JWN51_1069 [Phycisphaerales bacterium]|jgi:hypothetical protein|nr:hypothetical protein [Phycisphaerales bacterium]
MSKQGGDLLYGKVPVARDDHHVHVALHALFAPGKRPEQECYHDVWRDSMQHVSQDIRESDRPHDELFERLKDRRVRICAKELVLVLGENSTSRELREFPLHCAGRASRPADDFP